MKNRSPEQCDFLYVLKDDETAESVCKRLCSTYDYDKGVILYRDPDDRSSSSSGARKYKACFIKHKKVLYNTIGELIEVSMGDQILHEEGLIPKDAKNFAELIKKAYDEKLKHKKLILADMQRTLQAYDGPRYKNACEQEKKEKDAKEKKEKDAQENTANETLIYHLATAGVEEPKVKSTEAEHKQPQTTPDQDNQCMNYPLDVEIIGTGVLPKVVEDIVFSYTGDGFPNMPTQPSYAQFKFFNRPYLDLLHSKVTKLGNMILPMGEVDMLLAKVDIERNSTLFDIKVILKDSWGTPLPGTLLEILVKLNDFKLFKTFAEAGGVSPEKVEKALECVRSDKAKIENKTRIQRYKEIFIEFGKSICQGINKEEAFKIYKEKLQKERKKEVHLGFVFDPSILQEAFLWFSNNESLFGGQNTEKSDIFWVNGFGTLQSMLSACDARVISRGVRSAESIIDNSYYTDRPDPQLGLDFYLGTRGGYNRRFDKNQDWYMRIFHLKLHNETITVNYEENFSYDSS